LIFKVKGQIFRRGDTPRFALPLFKKFDPVTLTFDLENQ
jgi:hypothetical protein